MPSDYEFLAITGFRSTHAASTLVARLRDRDLLDPMLTERLMSGHLCAGCRSWEPSLPGSPPRPMKHSPIP
jgi:hypothetical protein